MREVAFFSLRNIRMKGQVFIERRRYSRLVFIVKQQRGLWRRNPLYYTMGVRVMCLDGKMGHVHS